MTKLDMVVFYRADPALGPTSARSFEGAQFFTQEISGEQLLKNSANEPFEAKVDGVLRLLASKKLYIRPVKAKGNRTPDHYDEMAEDEDVNAGDPNRRGHPVPADQFTEIVIKQGQKFMVAEG